MLERIIKILIVAFLLLRTIRSCITGQRELEQAEMQYLDEEIQLLELRREVENLTREEEERITEKIRKNNILTQEEEVQLRKLLKRVE